MSDITAEAGQLEQRELTFSYPCYKDMADNNIIFAFRGKVNSDLVTHVLEMMGDKLEDENESRKVSKKLGNVMVECLTNVYSDDDPNQMELGYDPTALLLVKKITNTYSVITGSYVPTRRVFEIKSMLDRINNMGTEELKHYYKEKLEEADVNQNGLTMLGMIDLARKSKHNLIYHFKHEAGHYTYFMLEARISAKSL
jgi:hypothetical protein